MSRTVSVDLVIFDLDGTLIDSRVDITNSVNVALRHVGLPPKTVDEMLRMVGNGTRVLVRRAVAEKPDCFEEAFAAFTKDYAVHLLDHTKLYPGALEAIDFLSAKKLAVMSNKRQRFCDAILKGLDIAQRFASIQGGDTPRAKKPDPAALLHICEILKIPPERAAMVGDSTVDVAAGKSAGMITVGLTEGFTEAETMKSSGANFVLPTVASLNGGPLH